MNSVILLVEDSSSDEKLTVAGFKRSGVVADVVVARDGAEALVLLLGPTPLPPPTLILLDLKLPRVDGLEVLQRIRAAERTKLIPVVILTASREREDITRAYALGANAYVRKPVDFAEFAEAAKIIGAFWLQLNERAQASPGGEA